MTYDLEQVVVSLEQMATDLGVTPTEAREQLAHTERLGFLKVVHSAGDALTIQPTFPDEVGK